ncbi:MAG TPA: hypothetical protein PLB65_08330, partial [Candidatus Cloacimonas sp.]|nr:hypothetical protein [Candidatus Cloacimonas sp.]
MTKEGFISYYPLKQGLKQYTFSEGNSSWKIFISYYPLKQGLKLHARHQRNSIGCIYILLSIKTRIETLHYLAVLGFGIE